MAVAVGEIAQGDIDIFHLIKGTDLSCLEIDQAISDLAEIIVRGCAAPDYDLAISGTEDALRKFDVKIPVKVIKGHFLFDCA